MAITATQAGKINKMNRASQDVSLGTIVQTLQGAAITSGSLLVSATQANGSSVSIVTGAASITGYTIGIFRGGSSLNSDPYVYGSNGSLVITRGSSYAVTTNDRINWMVF